MIKALRELDDLYFGCTRQGMRPSATTALIMLLTGAMPWGFVRDYRAGLHADSLARIAERKRAAAALIK